MSISAPDPSLGPSTRQYHAAVLMGDRHLYILGGGYSLRNDVVWRLNIDTMQWSVPPCKSGTVPPPFARAVAFRMGHSSRLAVWESTSSHYYTYDTAKEAWARVTTKNWHAVNSFPMGSICPLFDGTWAISYTDKLKASVTNLDNNEWTEAPIDGDFEDFAAWDSTFISQNSHTHLLWSYNNNTNSVFKVQWWRKDIAPYVLGRRTLLKINPSTFSSRWVFWPGLACLGDHYLLVMGGTGPDSYSSELWIVDLTTQPLTMRKLNDELNYHPKKKKDCSITVTPESKAIIFGGYTGSVLLDDLEVVDLSSYSSFFNGDLTRMFDQPIRPVI